MMRGPDVRERVGVTDAETTDIDITTGKINKIVHVVKEVATIKILREALSNHLFQLAVRKQLIIRTNMRDGLMNE